MSVLRAQYVFVEGSLPPATRKAETSPMAITAEMPARTFQRRVGVAGSSGGECVDALPESQQFVLKGGNAVLVVVRQLPV